MTKEIFMILQILSFQFCNSNTVLKKKNKDYKHKKFLIGMVRDKNLSKKNNTKLNANKKPKNNKRKVTFAEENNVVVEFNKNDPVSQLMKNSKSNPFFVFH